MKNKKKKHDYSRLKCPYCGGKVVLRSSTGIYKTSYGEERLLYVCSNYPECDAYVRCHDGTTIPIGELANGELRKLRTEAHKYFDLLYSDGRMSREDAYRWLSVFLNMPMSKSHIGCLNEYHCKQIIIKSREMLELRNSKKAS